MSVAHRASGANSPALPLHSCLTCPFLLDTRVSCAGYSPRPGDGHNVTLYVNCWYDERDMAIAFPSAWEVVECRMRGHDRPALTPEQMRAAVRNPFGSPRLCELAKDKREVVILFDDLPRPTPTRVNREFANCDLRVGIGGIIPHPLQGLRCLHGRRQLGGRHVRVAREARSHHPVQQHDSRA